MEQLKAFWEEEDGVGIIEIILILVILIMIIVIFKDSNTSQFCILPVYQNLLFSSLPNHNTIPSIFLP